MYPDPFNVRLIHDRMIAETLERHGPDHLLRERTRWPRPLHGLNRTITTPLSRVVDWFTVKPRAAQTMCLYTSGVGTVANVSRRTGECRTEATCR